MLYIFWFLHQTTTSIKEDSKQLRLYIFWFLHQTTTAGWIHRSSHRCISFDSYIKPQLILIYYFYVVYLLIPTSNHNFARLPKVLSTLYIFWFLHQTTTSDRQCNHQPSLYIFWFLHQTTTADMYKMLNPELYIFWFLHQTTTMVWLSLVVIQLYIFWFLHQTTTVRLTWFASLRCISFDSYIKPQLRAVT